MNLSPDEEKEANQLYQELIKEFASGNDWRLNMADEYKLVIVMRKDLNMRAGKMVAQGGHAVEGILEDGISSKNKKSWKESGHKKICVRTDTEEEFFQILRKVEDSNLQYHLVIDSGLTEFGGVPTKTCFAVGPALSSIIDDITGNLKLL